MKLFGYKRWFEEKVDGKNFKRKIKVKKENYTIKQDEKNLNNDIKNTKFINELITYKTRGNKLGNKFNDKNILFKINKNFEINCIEIIQSKELGTKNKELADKNNKNKNIYSKNNYSRILDKEKENLSGKKYLQILDNADYRFYAEEVGGEFVIKLYADIEEFKSETKKNTKEKAIFYKEISEDKVEIKREIYKICESINEKLFNIMKKISKIDIETRKIREEFLLKIENPKKIIEEFSSLKEKVKKYDTLEEKQEKDIIYFLEKLFNLNKEKTSDNKKIFMKKIMGFLKDEIEEIKDDDIKEFLVDEGIHFDILRRKEGRNKLLIDEYKKIDIYEEKNKKIKWNLINTYIKKDNHTRYASNKNEMKKKIQNIIDIYNFRQNEIEDILKAYNIEKLKEIVKQEIENSKKIDTNLFGKLKEHYKEICREKEEIFIREKELSKIIYRYIKGRIEKIINVADSNNYKKKLDKILDFEKLKEEVLKRIDEILDFEEVKEKVLKRIEQYIIENLIYLGKIKLLGLEEKEENEIRKSFIEYQAKEELDFEILTFISATNMRLCEIAKETKDFLSDNKDYYQNLSKDKLGIFSNLFNSKDKFEAYRKKLLKLRGKIIHRGNGKYDNLSVMDLLKTKDLGDNYKDLENSIKKLKISDEEICKNLNFDIIYGNNEDKIKLIEEINKIEIAGKKENRFFPSFSRLVPHLKNRLLNYKNDKNEFINLKISDDLLEVIINAYIYVNKILYYKLIYNWEKYKSSEKKDKNEKSLEEQYKEAQIKASKGEKKAVQKFQNKFIESYLKVIEKKFGVVFDYSYLTEKTLEKLLEERNEKKNIVLKSLENELKINNDFEYIIAMSSLLIKENTYINKIRNRLASTDIWLERDNFNGIIKILDFILETNTFKREFNFEFKECEKFIKKENFVLRTKINSFTFKDVCHYFEKIIPLMFKEALLEKDLEIFHEPIEKLIKDKVYVKKISDEMKKSSLVEGKYISELNDLLRKLKDEYEKIEKNIKEEIENEYKKINLPIKQYIDYTKFLNEEEFKNKIFRDIYYQELKNNEEDKLTYRQQLFYLLNNHKFGTIYENFHKKKIEKLISERKEIDFYKKDIIKDITEVNNYLTTLNNKLKGYSKRLKEEQNKEYKDKIKEKFDRVENYKSIKSILEFHNVKKIINYLVEISWKLSIQVSRVERDIEFIYTGLEELNKTSENKSTAKERLEDISKKLKIKSLEELKTHFEKEKKEKEEKEEKSLRNYIAHFYILTNPFEKSIISIIKEVDELLSYRTRYNNAVYNSCFEVFKRDVTLDYDRLKQKIEFGTDEVKNKEIIREIIKEKKVSVLELSSVVEKDNLDLIVNFLTYKENK